MEKQAGMIRGVVNATPAAGQADARWEFRVINSGTDREIMRIDAIGVKCVYGNFISTDGSVGVSGTFVDNGGKTVRVKNGIITDLNEV